MGDNKVLIVDDEIEVCNALEKYLSLKGYEVETAQDGATAIVLAYTFNPKVVLLDIMMPKMGGLDVLKRMRNIVPESAIIMITALNDNEIGKLSFNLGAFDFITKPINLNYLESAIMLKMLEVI